MYSEYIRNRLLGIRIYKELYKSFYLSVDEIKAVVHYKEVMRVWVILKGSATNWRFTPGLTTADVYVALVVIEQMQLDLFALHSTL